MTQSKVSLYYKNVTSDIIGAEHGISKQQFASLADKLNKIIIKENVERNDGKTGYRDLPYNDLISSSVTKMAASVKGIENFVVLGIGGSALGNIALQTALNPYMYNIDSKQRKGPRLFVFDNVDPDQLASFLDWIADKLDKTMFNVISKSGRTAETASQFLTIWQMLNDRFPGKLADHVIATTDPKEGTLRNIANAEKLRTLEVPAGVGGRFSVLSAVGLLSAAVCGIDIDKLLAGARAMDQRVSYEDFYQNPAAINAAVNWHCYNAGKRISVMMPYSYSLKDMSDWYRQLWAESLGKAKDLNGADLYVGPTPVKALGATDQHSQVQLYREGPNDKLYTFLQVKEFKKTVKVGPNPDYAPELDYLNGIQMADLFNSEKLGTEFALVQNHRPCMTVLFDKVDEFTVGQFIYLFEVTTSFAGKLFNLNTYDQPAVELGKEATFAVMGRPGYEDLAKKIKPIAEMDKNFII
jgi:glucose-6-phosphate isomerase